jgi:hypothetical protein
VPHNDSNNSRKLRELATAGRSRKPKQYEINFTVVEHGR